MKLNSSNKKNNKLLNYLRRVEAIKDRYMKNYKNKKNNKDVKNFL